MSATVLIIGVGNGYRGDDGAGLAVVRALTGRTPPDTATMERCGDCVGLLDAWEGARAAILVDAMEANVRPGTIWRIDSDIEDLHAHPFVGSSHALGIAEAVALAQALGTRPPHLILYGIEGRSFHTGAGLSPEVERAVADVAGRIVEEANRLVEIYAAH